MNFKVEIFLHPNVIIEKSDNITIENINPSIEKENIINSSESHDGDGNAYYSIINYHGEYRMYYRAIGHPVFKNSEKTLYYGTEELMTYECFCLATSRDGINFEKKNYTGNVEMKNKLIDNNFCHNFSPYFDKKKNILYGLSGTNLINNGIYLFNTSDGIEWNLGKKILDENYILPGWAHINHFDSLNCVVYNEKEDLYYIFVRHNEIGRRLIQYTTTKDFNSFEKCRRINIIEGENMNFYIPNIFHYENSDYYFSIPTIPVTHITLKNCNCLMISDNCIDWYIVNKNLFDDNDRMSVQYYTESNDKKKIYFYTHENTNYNNNYINCYSLYKNKFVKISSKEEGKIVVKKKLKSNILKINYEIYENGFIEIIIKKNNEIICISDKIYINEEEKVVYWNIENYFEPNLEFTIEFILNNSSLYSFLYEC